MSAQTALLLTEKEWDALRTVADFYLLATSNRAHLTDVYPELAKARALCDRIMEAT